MNKTSRVEFTVELVRILTAIAIAYAVALVTLFAVSDDPVYIIQQFVLGPFSSVRRVGSIINLAIVGQALTLLVTVSSMHYCTSTPALSTSSSSRGFTSFEWDISS